MNRILLVSATAAEIAPFCGQLAEKATAAGPALFRLPDGSQLRICISGVGMMASAYSLGRLLATESFDFAVQAGIAGAFSRDIPLGSLVRIAADRYGDLGAEDHNNYIDITELGFLDADAAPFAAGWLPSPERPTLPGYELPALRSISVNTVSGREQTISERAARYGAQAESMEGAAFHYACLQQGLPFVQLRAVSNYVTPRDRSSWQIGPAIRQLNDYLTRLWLREDQP